MLEARISRGETASARRVESVNDNSSSRVLIVAAASSLALGVEHRSEDWPLVAGALYEISPRYGGFAVHSIGDIDYYNAGLVQDRLDPGEPGLLLIRGEARYNPAYCHVG